MDPAHLHLMVNHLPILGSMLSLPLIGIAAWVSEASADDGE